MRMSQRWPAVGTALIRAGVLMTATLLVAGCRGTGAPADPAPAADPDNHGLVVTHTPGPGEPGEEYWTPERMDGAIGEMPTEDPWPWVPPAPAGGASATPAGQ